MILAEEKDLLQRHIYQVAHLRRNAIPLSLCFVSLPATLCSSLALTSLSPTSKLPGATFALLGEFDFGKRLVVLCQACCLDPLVPFLIPTLLSQYI